MTKKQQHRSEVWAAGVQIENPGQVKPCVLTWVRWLIWPIVHFCFRPKIIGFENLPPDRPYLLVANHSAGMGLAEIFSFLALYLRAFGTSRPLAGFALPVGFKVYPQNAVLRSIGAIPSTYAAADTAIKAGVPILVFPGGDHETLRPVWQANRVDFGGRVVFLRIAAKSNIPLIPLGIYGSHYTAPILWRSKWLAYFFILPRLLGIKRWGLTVLGLIGVGLLWPLLPDILLLKLAVTWLWLASPFVLLPWLPWTIKMSVGKPLEAHNLFDKSYESLSDKDLKSALTKIEASIQSELERAHNL